MPFSASVCLLLVGGLLFFLYVSSAVLALFVLCLQSASANSHHSHPTVSLQFPALYNQTTRTVFKPAMHSKGKQKHCSRISTASDLERGELRQKTTITTAAENKETTNKQHVQKTTVSPTKANTLK